MKRIWNATGTVVKFGSLVLLIGGLAAIPFVYLQVDRELTRHCRLRFADAFPQLDVQLRSARIVDGEGIELRGLQLSDTQLPAAARELLEVDELLLVCNTEFKRLVTGQIEPREIILRGPHLRATLRPDGTWTVDRLWPLPRFGDRPVPLRIERGTVEIRDPHRTPQASYRLQNVSLRLEPRQSADGRNFFEFRGNCSGSYLQQAEFSGQYDLATGQASITGRTSGLSLCRELFAQIATPLARHADSLQSVRAVANFTWQVRYNPAFSRALAFSVAGDFAQVRLESPGLPVPLSEVRGRFRADENGFEIEQLSARSGRATLQGRYRSSGYGAQAPRQLQLQARGLRLESELVEDLPAELEFLRPAWYKFLPSGAIDLDAQLNFDGRQWRPYVQVVCQDVAFTYHRFPYRLTHARGKLVLREQELKLDLLADAGGQDVQIEGTIWNPGPDFSGAVEVRGEGLTVSAQLLGALPERIRNVVQSLHPQGAFDCFVRLERASGQAGPPEKYIALQITSGTVIYDRFPYPITGVQGEVKLERGVWSLGSPLRPLIGANGAGRITCYGTLEPAPGGNQLALHIDGEGIALDAELRDALNPQQQRLWNALRPQGAVDLATEVRYQSGTRVLSTAVRATPVVDTVSITPISFPYRLEGLQGEIVYRDGVAQWKRLKAVHGATEIACGGRTNFLRDGGWQLRLEPLSIHWHSGDREFVEALPDQLRRAITGLRPEGRADVFGLLQLTRPADPSALLMAEWDLGIEAVQLALDCGGLRLQNIHGGVKQLAGRSDGRNFFSRGDLQIDSLSLFGHQLTAVRGPISVNNQGVVLGSWETESDDGRPPRRLAAELYGGMAIGDAIVRFDNPVRYALRAAITQAELRELALEQLPGRQALAGKIHANVELQGAGRGAQGLSGGGAIRLRDADVYELPVMVALLKLLSIRPPDTNAFTESNIDFQIVGDHVYLKSIDFKGDAVSLHGHGEMNWDAQLNVTCSAIVGRNELPIPLLRGLVREASERIMPVRIAGTLNQPEMRIVAFPVVNEAIEQFQQDVLRTSSARSGILPWRRIAGQSQP